MFLTVALPKFKRDRYEVIPWRDFFDEMGSALTPRQKRKISALLAGATAAYVLRLDVVEAAGIADKIVRAFDPIIDLSQGLAYPISFLMITGGFLLLMVGQRSKGLAMMKWAAVGYIGIQFAPAIMQILVSVGKAMVAR